MTLLGTGVGIPQPGRSQSGLVIEAKEPLLFDCGAGTLLRLTEAKISPLDLDTVFLTHLHLDHVSDVLPLAKARYLLEEDKFDIYGPVGTEKWCRTVQSLYPYVDMEITIHELEAGETATLKGFRITTAEAIHSVTSLGYRIDTESRSVVYSGDTEPTSSIADLARGADLLIHECSFPEPYQVTNHTTPKLLGAVVDDAKRIVLTHLYPQTIGHEETMIQDLLGSLSTYIPVEIGQDLQRICL